MHLTDVIVKLVDRITEDENFRVPGPQEKYRCKATYSLYPKFSPSITVSDSVNKVCNSVNQFVVQESRFATSHPRFFFEVMCKENRQGEFMVKLVFLNEVIKEGIKDLSNVRENEASACLTLWEKWTLSTEPADLVAFIRSQNPSVQLIVGHIDLKPSFEAGYTEFSKPTKSSSYIPLAPHSTCTLREFTPNHKTYELSPDSFCEVNHEMETKIFYYICHVLKLEVNSETRSSCSGMDWTAIPSFNTQDGGSIECLNGSQRHLFLCGRDILAMFASLESYYSSVYCVTSCPSVFEDAKRHPIPHCKLQEKNRVLERLHEFCATSTTGPLHLIFTSGRHGLHPSTLVELLNSGRRNPFLMDFIYISCNKASLARDFHVLKEGFRMENVAVFDFFPQTPYQMTVVHWKPYTSVDMNGSLLVLPVGPSGSGKTICGSALRKMFATPQPADVVLLKKTSMENQVYVLDEQMEKDNSVPRKFLQIESSLSVFVFERDLFFKTCRDQKLSLSKSKTETHAALLQFLRNACPRKLLYIDSTNTYEDARALYTEIWSKNACQLTKLTGIKSSGASICIPSSSSIQNSSVVEIHFACRDSKTLLDRVRQRIHHPSFPTAEDEQVRKIKVILNALQNDTNDIHNSTFKRNKFWINNFLTEQHTLDCVQFVVCAHLFFSPFMAQTLCHRMELHLCVQKKD